MGNKGGKVPAKPPKLTSKDIKHLTKQTGLTKEKIQEVFDKFSAGNPGISLSFHLYLYYSM